MAIDINNLRQSAQKILDDARNPNNPSSSISSYLQQAQQRIAAEQAIANEAVKAREAEALAREEARLAEINRQNEFTETVTVSPLAQSTNTVIRENRTLGEVVQDTATSVGKGLVGAGETAVTINAAAEYGMNKAVYALLKKDFDYKLQNILDQADEQVRLPQIKALVDSYKSPVTARKEQEMAALAQNPNLTEDEKFLQRVKYYQDNPDMAVLAAVQSFAQSAIETAIGGKIVKGSMYGLKTTLFGTGAVSGASGQLNSEQEQGVADDDSFLRAGGVGVLTGGLALAGNRLSRSDVDSFGARALTNAPKKEGSAVVGLVKDPLVETGEEMLTAVGETIAINDATGKAWNADMGVNLADAGVVGFTSSAMHNSVSGLDQGGKATKDFVNTKLEQRDDKKNGSITENMDPKSDKYNPARAFQTAINLKGSADPKERQQAMDILTTTSNQVSKQQAKLKDAIDNASTDEELDAAKKAYEEFDEKYAKPLQAQVNLYVNNAQSNRENILGSLDELSKTHGSSIQKYFDESYSNIKKAQDKLSERKPVETNTTPTTTPTTQATQPVQGGKQVTNSFASLIQSGESGSAEYTAVNFGNKKSGTLDLSNMTYGQVVSGMGKGEYVAVGKYQFHKSSLPEVAGKLPWLNRTTKMTPEVQDRIFAEYYMGRKRPALADYIRGGGTSLNAAHKAAAREWAAMQGPDGKGYYGGNNSATISANAIQAQLKQSRAIYAQARKEGKSDAEAMRLAVLGESTYTVGTNGSQGSSIIPKAKVSTDKFVVYKNQNAKRNEPISDKLADSMSFLANMGVTVHINSGGQSDTSNGRVGSDRHDHGNSFDGDFYKDGRKLNWKNKEDQKILAEIVTQAVAHGVTGIGAGDGYMGGNGRMHFGFGKPAVWGKTLSRDSAPKWLVDAYNRGVQLRDSGSVPNTTKTQELSNALDIVADDGGLLEVPLTQQSKEETTEQKVETTEQKPVENFVEPKGDDPESQLIKEKLHDSRLLFSTMTPEEIDKHPLLTPQQKEDLRKLTEYKRKLADMNDTEGVRRDVIFGRKGKTNQESHLGLKQYDEIFTNAIAANDVGTVNRHLAYLKRFHDNYQAKNEAIEEVLLSGKASEDNPIWVAPDKDGKWKQYTQEQADLLGTQNLRNAGGFKVTTSNKGTSAVARDAADVAEAFERWSRGTASIMEGVKPLELKRSSYVANEKVATNTTKSKQQTQQQVKEQTKSDDKFSQVNRAASAEDSAIAHNDNAVYIGRAGAGKNTRSINQVNVDTGEGVGQPGWLGDGSGKRGISPKQRLSVYNDAFKKRFANTPNFAESVLELKNKDVYVNVNANKASEAGYITDLLDVIPDDINEAKAFVERIESYHPDTGFSLRMQTYKTGEKPKDGLQHVTDSDFGFDSTNQFDLISTNDEKYTENKVAIDKAIDKIVNSGKESAFPEDGIGYELQNAAPRTLSYFNKQVKERLHIDNQALLDARPEVIPRADTNTRELKTKNVLPITKQNKSNAAKQTKPVAETIKAKGIRSELTQQSTETLTDYENSYTSVDNSGAERTISIKRSKEDNSIIGLKVVNKTTGKVFKPEIEDKTFSDKLIVKEIEDQLAKVEAKFTQDGKDITATTPKSEVDGRTVPTEVLDKEVKLEDVVETYKDGIEENRVPQSEQSLYNALLAPILAFNPKTKLKVKSGKGTNGYDAAKDVITVHTGENSDRSLHQEITRIAVNKSINQLADSLDSTPKGATEKDIKRLQKIDQDLSRLKSKVMQAINAELAIFKNLPTDVQIKILSAMETNSSFLTAASTDADMIKFLKAIPTSEKRKVKSNIFKKMVKALTTFFNLGNTKEVTNAFTQALELTSRIMSEQARDYTVDFSKSENAKLAVYHGEDLDARVEAELVKPYFQRNQLIAKFKQVVSKEKPLTQVVNFSAKLKLDMMQGLQKFTSTPPDKAQRKQVADFLQFRDDLAVHLRETFRSKESKPEHKRNYGYQDLKTFLVDENGELDENTITAVALAVYDWAIEYGNKEFNQEKDIRKLLNLDPDEKVYIPADIRNQYTHVGRIKSVTAISIGKTAVDALGLKDTDKASAESMSSLQASIGEWAISAMQAADLIHIQTMPTETHIANINRAGGDTSSVKEINPKGIVSFISITDAEGSNINARLNEVVQASRGTKGYLGKVFGTDIGLRPPLLEKPTKVRTRIKRTKALMSPRQQKLVKKMQEEPITINNDMYDVLQSLLATDRETTLKMIGAIVTEEQLAAEHIDDRPSKLSAAEGVMRDLVNGLDFIDSLEKLSNGERQEFYDTVYAAKNNRMHHNSNMFNFQSSKLHRSLGEYTNFKNDIDITGVTLDSIQLFDDKGQISAATLFLRGVAESAEGTKGIIEAALKAKGIVVSDGFTVDKLPSELFIEPFYEYLTTDKDVARAMVGVRKLLNREKATKADIKAIQKVVDFWEGGPNSLRALVEYTKFEHAVSWGDPTFTTSLGLGSDGINNGSAISYVQLGAANPKFLAQVGMLTNESGFTNYFDTRGDTSIGDYYTGFGPFIEEATKEIIGDSKETKNLVDRIKQLNTTFDGRKSFKAVLIPFGYSAGFPRLRQLIFGQFMSDIKSQMKAVAKLDPTDPETETAYQTLQDNINSLLPEDKHIELPRGKDILEYSIPFSVTIGLNKVYDEVMGEITVKALENYAATFIDARDRNIKIQGATYNVYAKLRELLIKREEDKYKAHLKQSHPEYQNMTDKQIDEIFDAEGIPQEYWNEVIKPQLDAIRPGVKTPFNQADKGDTKETDFRITRETSELKADEHSQATNWKVSEGQYIGSSTKLPKRKEKEESVGVMVNSAQVQGTDGLIAAISSALGGNVNINVHDAAIGGLLNYNKMVKTQNKATYEALRDYHAQTASLLALSESIKSIVDMRKEGLIDDTEQDQMVVDVISRIHGKKYIEDWIDSEELTKTNGKPLTLKDIGTEDFFNQIIAPYFNQLVHETYQTEMRKFEILDGLYSMHQYGGEGGQYVITDADKAKIKKQIQVVQDIHQEIHNNLNSLSDKNDVNLLTKKQLDDSEEVYDLLDGLEDEKHEMDILDLKDKLNQLLDKGYTVAVTDLGLREDGQVVTTGPEKGVYFDRGELGKNTSVDLATLTGFVNQAIGIVDGTIPKPSNTEPKPQVAKSVEKPTNTNTLEQYVDSLPEEEANRRPNDTHEHELVSGWLHLLKPTANEAKDMDSFGKKVKEARRYPRKYLAEDGVDILYQGMADKGNTKVVEVNGKKAVEMTVGTHDSIDDILIRLQSIGYLLSPIAPDPEGTPLNPAEIINHSGGAYGGDTLWDRVGREFGVINHKHYREANNARVSKTLRDSGVKATILSEQQMETARSELSKLLGKKYPNTIAGNLQVRNYYQVANADSVFAIASISSNAKDVSGGTNTAVQLGIKLGKPVHVWDVKSERWYTYSTQTNTFVESDTPHLTKNFAGVGSRDIENYNVKKNGVWGPRPQYVGKAKADKAYQAVKDVYAKSLNKDKSVSPPQSSGRKFKFVTGSGKKLSTWMKGIISELTSANEEIAPHRIETLNYLASKLKDHKKVGHEITFSVVPSIITKGGKVRNAHYSPDTGVITLSAKAMNSMSLDKQVEIITHELWHSATHITRTTSKDPKVRQANATLDEMRKQLLKVFPKGTFMHDTVLANVDEFVAYGMTDPEIGNLIAENLKGEYSAPGKRVASSFLNFIKQVAQLFTGTKANTPEGQRNFETFARLADVLTKQPTADEVITYRSNPQGTLFSTQKPTDGFKSLEATNVSKEHNEHLDAIFDSVVGDFMQDSVDNTNQVDAIANAPDTRAIRAGFKLSDKELAAAEIVKAIAAHHLTEHSGTKTAAELRATYRQITSQLTREHFLSDPNNATKAEVKAAQRKLDYIKKHDNINKYEHIERFVSLAIASEEFRNIINQIDNSRKVEADPNTGWFNKLMTWFTNTMQTLTGKHFGTDGLKSSSEVDMLLNRLNNIAHRHGPNMVDTMDKAIMKTGSMVSTPANWVVKQLTKAIFGTLNLAHVIAPNSSIGTLAHSAHKIKQSGGVLSHLDQMGDEIAKVNYNKNDGSNRLGGWGELVVEASRNVGMKKVVERLIRTTNKASQDRATVASSTTKALGSLFKDVSEVPKEQLDSITQVALRTDMSALLSHGVNINRVLRLLRDPSARAVEVARLENEIKNLSPEFNDIILQTKTLALYMAKEEAGEFLVKNAEGIAIGLGSWYETDIDSMDTDLRDAIDQLASLYAVDMTTTEQQQALTNLIINEPEAIKGLLNHHLDMTKRSKQDFEGNQFNYAKGYMPQKTHNLRSLMFAENEAEIRKLKAKGWQIIGDEDMSQDKSDKTEARTLMFHNDMLYKDYVSGALDMKDTHAKGTTIYDINSNFHDMNRVTKERLSRRRARNQHPYDSYNVAKQGRSHMIANYNSEGKLVNYHYEMSGRLRDTYLERDNNALELMGMYHSNLVFKPQIAESQRNVAQALYEDFTQSWSKDPKKFVTLDPKSDDPEVIKMWRMMPYAFREEAQALFGKDQPIVVRATAFNTVFGYHTYSLSDMFEKLGADRNHLEKIFVTIMSALFGDKAQMRVLQGERLVQKGVAQMKDFIVIRNAKVLLGNIVANSLILTLKGVPPGQQIRDFISVWRNGGQYRKLAGRVAEIDAEIAINRNRPQKLRDLKRERNEAMQEMERNPMHTFMKEGLMSSIVEDTAVYKDDDGFQSEFDKKLEAFRGHFPSQVLTATDWVLMSPGTPMHNFMSHATQFSDLAAKYSLANHHMKNGTDLNTAIALAQDVFINYDVPTGRGIDYMNKIGLFMFTKFAIRFQQAMIAQLGKNASATIAQHVAVEHLTGMPGVLDPLFIHRMGNPFHESLFGYDDAFKNISTIDAIRGLFD